MSYRRTLAIDLPPGQSAFLWGARQTGKSTWLRERFPESHHIDMLDFDTALGLQARPSRLGERLDTLPPEVLARPIVIDEVQKAPGLLDEVHRLIESRRLSFILCGSSARKLRREGVNLLGGRAWRFEMFPLTWSEVPDFDLLQTLNRGLLPGIHSQASATGHRRSLAAYVRDYLMQEVFNEALVRSADAFARFFEALRFCHGELLNYAAIARDCGVDAKTVRTYFEILRDTLVGYLVYPFSRREGRQTISATPRFYLFDVGVAAFVQGAWLQDPSGAAFGKAFEHFLALEIIAARSYQEKDYPIEFWRTKSGLEVDFVLNRGEVAVEAKSRVRSQDLRPMRAFVEEHSPRQAIVVTAERDRRRVDGIEIMPYPSFLELLHAGEIV